MAHLWLICLLKMVIFHVSMDLWKGKLTVSSYDFPSNQSIDYIMGIACQGYSWFNQIHVY